MLKQMELLYAKSNLVSKKNWKRPSRKIETTSGSVQVSTQLILSWCEYMKLVNEVFNLLFPIMCDISSLSLFEPLHSSRILL